MVAATDPTGNHHVSQSAGNTAQETLHHLLEQVSDAAVIADGDGKVRFFNAAAEKLWNVDRRDALGQDMAALTGEQSFADPIKAAAFLREIILKRGDGTKAAASVSISEINTADDRFYLSLLRDVTGEMNSREELRLLSLAIDATDRVIFVLDDDKRFVFVNRAFVNKFGYTLEDVKGKRPTSILASERTEPGTLERLRSETYGIQGVHETVLARARNGNEFWVSATVNPIMGDDGRMRNLIGVLADITESKLLEALQRDILEAVASDMSLAGVSDFLCRKVEEMAPELICSILLVDPDNRLRPLASPGIPESYSAALDGLAIGEGVGSCGTAAFRGEAVRVQDIANDPLWAPYKHLALSVGLAACWSSPIRQRDGRVTGTFGIYYRTPRAPDVWHEQIVDACLHLCMIAIERHEAREQIARLSHFDALTGLPNRTRIIADTDEHLLQEKDTAAVLFLDLDYFKDVNETLGHSAGDALLLEVAGRWQRHLRPGDLLGRIGGDEFVIFVPDCNVQRISVITERLLETLKAPVEIAGVALNVSASVGIAMYPQDGDSATSLFRQADIAMNRAKEDQRGNYCFFSPEMNRIAQERLILGSALRDAISMQTLRLHYQPQVCPATGELYGVEALSRWNDPELGEISPAKFIALAEEIGEIEAIGFWSLREACRQMAQWRDQGIEIPVVSVNLSPLHLRNDTLPSFVAGLIAEHGLQPDSLTIEITESIMLDARPETFRNIHALRDQGIGLSMDDFGTGYSSLSNLALLPVTELKIDRGFMRDFVKEPAALALARAAVRIGQSLGLKVVAEGVETDAQRQVLVDLECDVAQGYFYSRALDPESLIRWIKERNSVQKPVPATLTV